MAETAAQRAKREGDARRAAAAKAAAKVTPKPAAPKVNTSKSQSTGGVLKSLLPGGQKANFGGLGQSTANFLGEASGAYDIKRGVQKIGQGNVLGGLGSIGLGLVGAVPVVGGVARGATTALKAAGALNKINTGSKFVQAATKTGTILENTAARAYKPLIGTTKVAAKDASLLTKARVGTGNFAKSATLSPLGIKYATLPAVGGFVNAFKGGLNTAAAAPTGPLQGPGLDGRDQFTPTTTQNPPMSSGNLSTLPEIINPILPTPPRPPNIPPTGDGSENPDAPGGTGAGTGSGTGSVGSVGGSNFVNDAMSTFGTQSSYVAPQGAPSAPQGMPAGVQLAGADFAAGLAANAAKTYAQEAANREALSQGFMGAAGTAADIYGGRAAGIMGQGITGQRRNFVTSEAQRAQESLAQQSALAQAYSQAVAAAYGGLGNNALEQAQLRSEAAAQIRSMG